MADKPKHVHAAKQQAKMTVTRDIATWAGANSMHCSHTMDKTPEPSTPDTPKQNAVLALSTVPNGCHENMHKEQ